MKKKLAFCCILLLLNFFSLNAWSQEATRIDGKEISEETQATAKEISGEVLSPFCPGRSLNDCPSSAASDLKDKIVGMLADGKNKEEVRDYLFSLYGENLSAVPKVSGFGLIAWLMPFIFILLGFICFLLWLKSSKGSANSEIISKSISLDEESKRRIDLEIKG